MPSYADLDQFEIKYPKVFLGVIGLTSMYVIYMIYNL